MLTDRSIELRESIIYLTRQPLTCHAFQMFATARSPAVGCSESCYLFDCERQPPPVDPENPEDEAATKNRPTEGPDGENTNANTTKTPMPAFPKNTIAGARARGRDRPNPINIIEQNREN
ncbi:hypothetical protein N9K47_00395 [bacterium]|nr:hypothetical protein [bacterium]